MTIVEIPQKTEISENELPIQSDFISILREIRLMLDNPFVQQVLAKKLDMTIPVPENPQLPGSNPGSFTKDMFLKFIQTEKGKKMLIDGISELQDTIGDVKLSELTKMLEKGELKNE